MERNGRAMSGGQKPERKYWRHVVGWPLLLLGVNYVMHLLALRRSLFDALRAAVQ